MTSDVLDLRDLAREWRDELEGSDELDQADLFALLNETEKYRDLSSELGVDGTPDSLEAYGDDFEPTLIHAAYFTTYAQELAEDIGAVGSDNQWPLYCIDWERAARELKADYREVTFDGETYYIRA